MRSSSASSAWLGKIAFDEAFAKYSPGVLQILDATESLFAEGGIALVDSCAIPDHPMIDNIWRDRIAMADVLIGTPNMPSARFKAMVAAEKLSPAHAAAPPRMSTTVSSGGRNHEHRHPRCAQSRARNFSKHPFALKHGLADNPLFSLDRLVRIGAIDAARPHRV